jgi:hypothetical protein
MLSINAMNFNAAFESGPTGAGKDRKSQTDSLVANLCSEFPNTTPCEIRVAVLQAEENLWPKKDTFLLLDHARDLLRRGIVA